MAGRLKIILITGMCVLAIFVVVMAAFYLDLAGHLATGSKTYEPDNATIGKAIIVYSPGWTGLTWYAVDNVAGLLADKGYEVETAGVNSGKTQNLSDYNLVIVASPNYGKRPTDRAGAFIESMQPDEDAAIGVLCTSAGNTSKGADAVKARIEGRGMSVKAIMILALNEPAGPASTGFVEELLSD